MQYIAKIRSVCTVSNLETIALEINLKTGHMVLYLQPFLIDGLIGTILKGCLVVYTQLSNSNRTSKQKYKAIFFKEFHLLEPFIVIILSCILGQLLMPCAEGDSLSIPVWRQSVCHWHTPLLTASLTPFHSPLL